MKKKLKCIQIKDNYIKKFKNKNVSNKYDKANIKHNYFKTKLLRK